jgi:uncharacterized protein YjbI with pentapeptide repeats
MGTEQAIKLERIKRRVEAADADLSGSTFTDVNLAGAAIVQCATDGMTINGIALSDLLAAYQPLIRRAPRLYRIFI